MNREDPSPPDARKSGKSGNWSGARCRLHRLESDWPGETLAEEGLPWPQRREDYWERAGNSAEMMGQARCPVCRHVLVPRALACGPKYCCACPD